ncbi:MAG TPA: hypothetical protein VHZ52_16450 [Acidobacteriaceae bacterium]|jgi:hypothetical protein|nr:hypothetical protein [Acidobacteriaceae bacterium]
MTKFQSIAMWIACAAVALPAAHAAGRVAIETDRIASAITRAGLPVSAHQVTLLSDVEAATGAPALKVESMQRAGDGRTMVRLSCAAAEECLPFYVAIRGNDDVRKLQDLNSPIEQTKPTGKAIVMRSGSQATLLLDGDRIHIQLAVVCLESGGVGQAIRVSGKDRKMVYRAEIVDGTTLRGRL